MYNLLRCDRKFALILILLHPDFIDQLPVFSSLQDKGAAERRDQQHIPIAVLRPRVRPERSFCEFAHRRARMHPAHNASECSSHWRTSRGSPRGLGASLRGACFVAASQLGGLPACSLCGSGACIGAVTSDRGPGLSRGKLLVRGGSVRGLSPENQTRPPRKGGERESR